jgi:CHAT domain
MSNKRALRSILLVAANPKGTKNLRLQEEERLIKERLRLAGYGSTPINSIEASRPIDLMQAMLDFEPQVVHFSGHGAGQEGLVFEGNDGQEQLVSSDALANLFKQFSHCVECVVLNACYSVWQAEAIGKNISCIIGMSGEIGDRAAIEFAGGFYTALGAGKSIEVAYELGCNLIQLGGLPENLTPVIFRKAMIVQSSQSEYQELVSTQTRIEQGISQLVDNLQDTLEPDLKIALAWLSDSKGLADILGKTVLKQFPETQSRLLKDFRMKKRFDKELERCLYRLYYALLADNFVTINESRITLEPRIYQNCLDLVLIRIPTENEAVKEKFQTYIEYFKKRLDFD